VSEPVRASEIGSARNVEFIRSIQPILELYCRYFRAEVRCFDRLPRTGPFLMVGNHSGGQFTPDLPVLLSHWWRVRGIEEPVYALFHTFFLDLPGVGPTMAKAGGLEAGHGNAETVLNRGGVVIVLPGGDREVFRPWSERNKIDFGGRTGFVRLALRTRVPVVPFVSVGAHETLLVLSRGERIARLLRLDKMFRTKVWPIVVGPPTGIGIGGMPTLPLPAKITTEVLDPFDWPSEYGPEAADDDDLVEKLADQVTGTMQSALDDLAAERRFPVIG
jgi:1-acyl-sn-glycerol-3-phosphate acyltransferase